MMATDVFNCLISQLQYVTRTPEEDNYKELQSCYFYAFH